MITLSAESARFPEKKKGPFRRSRSTKWIFQRNRAYQILTVPCAKFTIDHSYIFEIEVSISSSNVASASEVVRCKILIHGDSFLSMCLPKVARLRFSVQVVRNQKSK